MPDIRILVDDEVMNRRIAKLPGVQAELKGHAGIIANIGTALLAPHRKTGSHKFVVQRVKVRYGRIDWFASFVGPAAAAVESGHWHNFTGQWVEGLHCLSQAMSIHAGTG